MNKEYEFCSVLIYAGLFLNFTGLYTLLLNVTMASIGHMLWILIVTLKCMQSCVVEILSNFHLKCCHLFFCL